MSHSDVVTHTILVTQFLDVLTTYLIIGSGGVEMNPLLSPFLNSTKSFLALLAIKLLLASLLVIGMRSQKRKREILGKEYSYTGAVLASALVAIMYVFVVSWNTCIAIEAM